MKTPPPTCSPAEAASVLDCVYVDRHPGELTYLREYVAGEFGSDFPPVAVRGLPGTIMVEVEKLNAFMRRRRPAFVALDLEVWSERTTNHPRSRASASQTSGSGQAIKHQ